MNVSISKKQKEKIGSYIKPGEIAVISANIRIDKWVYNEITFSRTNFGTIRNIIKGYIYIDETGNVVREKKLKDSIAELAYYNEFYYDTDSKISFSRALMNDKDIRIDTKNFKKAIRGLELLNLNGINETNILKNILENVPKFKLKNNEIIKEIINKVAQYKNSGVNFDLNIKETFQKIYDELLMINFQMIRNMAEGQNYYDDYKGYVKERTRQFMVRYNRRVSEPFNKLIYELSYFQVMINTYEKVLNLSYDNYVQYIKVVDKNNLQKRKCLIRI